MIVLCLKGVLPSGCTGQYLAAIKSVGTNPTAHRGTIAKCEHLNKVERETVEMSLRIADYTCVTPVSVVEGPADGVYFDHTDLIQGSSDSIATGVIFARQFLLAARRNADERLREIELEEIKKEGVKCPHCGELVYLEPNHRLEE